MPAMLIGPKCQYATEQREMDGQMQTFFICTTPKTEACPKDRKKYDMGRECLNVITAEDFLAIVYGKK